MLQRSQNEEPPRKKTCVRNNGIIRESNRDNCNDCNVDISIDDNNDNGNFNIASSSHKLVSAIETDVKLSCQYIFFFFWYSELRCRGQLMYIV